MAEAKFIGDPKTGGDGPETLKVLGHLFVKGEWMEVDDATAIVLASHSHFEVRQPVSAAENPHAGTESADWHDLDKADLISFAKSNGVTLDARKSLAKLQADLEDALGDPAEPEFQE